MPLINTSLSNLIQGVSQQPDAVRYDGQCDAQENALSSVVDGLQKRPATQFIGTSSLLDSETSANTFFHLYKRSNTEKYSIIQDGNTLSIHNADSGQLCTVTEPSSSDFTITNNKISTAGTYLATNTAQANLKALTVGDTTFLLNNAQVTDFSTATTSTELSNDTLIFIKQGDFSKKYGVTFDGTELFIRSRPAIPAENPNSLPTENQNTNTKAYFTDSNYILDALKQRLNGNTAYTDKFENSVLHSNLIVCERKTAFAATDYSAVGIDGLAGEGIGVVHKEVSAITDLPPTAPHNFKVKVIGDTELNQDDYYVKFMVGDGSPNDGDVGEGSWVETSGGGIKTDIDASKMPRVLVSTALNTFEIRRMSLNNLQAGDLQSNPYPSFVGNTITNLFQYKNRLGFLSLDAVILSEAGFGGYDSTTNTQSYNFFRTSVTDLLDSDPIDVNVASNNVTNLRSAQPFQENLILFSDNAQFVLKGGDLLTPKSISVTAVTNFDASNTVDPIPLGSYLYFPFQRGSFSGLREFTVNASSDVYDSNEVTGHVPQYIPSGLLSLTGSNSEELIAVSGAAGTSSTNIFIYKYFFNNAQKGLSSWSKFIVSGAVRGIQFLESDLFILQSKNNVTNLLKIPLESGGVDANGYNTHLDMRVNTTVSSGASTITLPYSIENTDTVQVYTHDGLKLDSTTNGATVTLVEPVAADTPVYVGVTYLMKYVFSKQLFKAPSGQSKSPSNASKLLIRNGSVFFNATSSFTVKVKPDSREEYINEFSPIVIGAQFPDDFKLTDGAFRFPVMTKADSVTITLENNSALPSNIQSAEFESFVHSRSNRYG